MKVLASEQGEMVSGRDLWYVIDGGRYAGGRIHSSLLKRIADLRPNTTRPQGSSATTYIVVDRSAFSLTLVEDGKPAFVTYKAMGLAREVDAHGYNPPKRDRILEWQSKQDFEICPDPGDSDACNVYKDLRFPDEVYESIAEYFEQKQEARE